MESLWFWGLSLGFCSVLVGLMAVGSALPELLVTAGQFDWEVVSVDTITLSAGSLAVGSVTMM